MLSAFKKIIFCLFLGIIVLPKVILSQEINQQAIDTLLEQYQLKDEKAKIKVLNRLIYEYSLFDSLKSFKYFKEQVRLVLKTKELRSLNWSYESLAGLLNENRLFGSSIYRIKKGINYSENIACKICAAYGYSYMGRTYRKMKQFGKSLLYHETAIVLFQEAEYNLGLGFAYYRKGKCHVTMGDYKEALKNLLKAENMLKHEKNKMDVGHVYYYIGIVKYFIGSYHEAIDYFVKSLPIWEKNNYKANIWNCYEMIGNIYLKLEDYNKALINHRKALSVRRNRILHNIKTGRRGGDNADSVNNLGLAYSFNNIGETYLKMGVLDSAYYYAKKSLKIKESGKNPATLNDVANSQLNLGNVLCALGKYDSAKIMITKALNKYEETKNKTSQIEAQYALGRLYVRLNMPELALNYYEKGLQIAINLNDLDNIKNGYKYLSDIYANLRNYQLSLHYFEAYSVLKDSILNLEDLSKIEELQIEYEVEKKDGQIKAQKNLIAQKDYNLILVIIAGSLLAIILIITIIFVIITRRHKVILLKKEAENLRQKLELKNKELVCNVRSIYVKNQVINKVARRLSKSTKDISNNSNKVINSLIMELKQNLDDTGWKEFEFRFSQVHESFYNNLHEKFPGLTENEKKLAAMLKLGLSSKEIASITMTQSDSVDTARSRLRKKLGISSDQNLTEFFNSI